MAGQKTVPMMNRAARLANLTRVFKFPKRKLENQCNQRHPGLEHSHLRKFRGDGVEYRGRSPHLREYRTGSTQAEKSMDPGAYISSMRNTMAWFCQNWLSFVADIIALYFIDSRMLPPWFEYDYWENKFLSCNETNHYHISSYCFILQWITLLGWTA